MNEFKCPHCGEDLRKVGIHERTIISYTFAQDIFVAREVGNSINNEVCCSHCYEEIDANFQISLPISRNVGSQKTETRYGNVIKTSRKSH